MAMRRWIWLLAGLALLLGMALPARAQGAGVLEGKVVNGTAGGQPIDSGAPVTLHIMRGDQELGSREGITDAQGAFRFDGLDTDPALSYWPEATYLGIPYTSSEGYTFDAQQQPLTVTLPVFETTEDGSTIELESVHLIAENLGQVLRISEVHVFSNAGDRTFVGRAEAATGDRRTTAAIPLPANTVGLGFPEGESPDRFVQAADALLDTEPVRPGNATSVAQFSYHLVADAPTVVAEHRFAYPVGMLSVLTVQPGLELDSPQLQAGEPMTFQGREYGVYAAQNVSPDAPVAITFIPRAEEETQSMLPAPSAAGPAAAPQGQQRLLRWLGFGLVGLAVVGVLVYPMVTRPRSR
jgi:hypothetical protein